MSGMAWGWGEWIRTSGKQKVTDFTIEIGRENSYASSTQSVKYISIHKNSVLLNRNVKVIIETSNSIFVSCMFSYFQQCAYFALLFSRHSKEKNKQT